MFVNGGSSEGWDNVIFDGPKRMTRTFVTRNHDRCNIVL